MAGETTVVISYNPIVGFSSGWHHDRKLFVCASDEGAGRDVGDGRDEDARARSVMHRISGHYYHGSVPVENVRQYIVYAGLHALDGAIGMVKGLKSLSNGAPITVAACSCDWGKKLRLLDGTDIRMIACECGGRVTMGKLALESLI